VSTQRYLSRSPNAADVSGDLITELIPRDTELPFQAAREVLTGHLLAQLPLGLYYDTAESLYAALLVARADATHLLDAAIRSGLLRVQVVVIPTAPCHARNARRFTAIRNRIPKRISSSHIS